MNKHFLPILLLIITGLIGTKALLAPGFFSSHDGEHQVVRQYFFDRALTAGHIPPRFDRQLHHNLGYPLFTFTYQLPFWLGEPFLGLGLSVQDTVKAVFILTYIASGLAMYLFASERWGKLGGGVAAFLYLWAPYRFLTIFVRASLGEHVAFIFLPLLLWALNRPDQPRLRIPVGAISIAGLLLSHSMFAQLAILPVGLFWLANFRRSLILNSLFIILLGVGLSAYYLLPALYYRGAIQGLNRTFYAEHFVTIKQLLYSKWGYTFSVFGENDGMSFQIGIAQWLAVLATIFFVVRSRIAMGLLVSFVLAIFLMTDPSSKIWEQLVKKWFVIDLPWRLLAVTTFTASALAGFVVSQLKSKFFKIAVVCSLLAISLYTNRNHLRVNERQDFDQNFLNNFSGTSNSYDEYQSVSIDPSLLKRDKNPSVEVISGQANIDVAEDKPHRLIFTIQVSQPAQIRINTTYFPGWHLYLDGQERNFGAIDLNPGSYSVNLIYRQTNFMQLANLISLVSSAIVALIYVKTKNGHRHAGI